MRLAIRQNMPHCNLWGIHLTSHYLASPCTIYVAPASQPLQQSPLLCRADVPALPLVPRLPALVSIPQQPAKVVSIFEHAPAVCRR